MDRRRIKTALDVALTMLLGCQMAYALVGEASHEITGLCMLALLALHHILNGGFHRRLFRGKYTLYRAALTTVDALMLSLFVLQGVSGLVMAKHVRILRVDGAGWARRAHLLGAYWGLALCGIHAGLHMIGLARRWQGLHGKTVKPLAAAIALGAAVYGATAFIKRGFAGYMTLQQQFVFFDFGESLVRFFIDYACILLLFMEAGCALGCLLTRRKRK